MIYDRILSLVQQHRYIGIISHFRPDGDAVGSTLALGLALENMGKTVSMWNEDAVPARYAFLEGADKITTLPHAAPPELELLICVDTGDWKRLGDRATELFAGFPRVINIDHHGTNTCYGHENLVVGGSAACGFVIYNMLRHWGCEISPAIANALYTAISTDTGSFQYSSTTPEVMQAAGELLTAGVDVGDINRRIYQEIPLSTLLVNREVLNHMIVECNGGLSHYSMPAGRKAELGIGPEDTKDLVDIIRTIQGVKVSAIFEDLEDGRIRISLRSKAPQINVAEIAARFGGGGHAMAAGIRMKGELENVRTRVLQVIREQLNEK